MTELDIFVAACDISDPSERASFLAEACSRDGLLRQRIEQLLRLSQRNDSFMEPDRDGARAASGESLSLVTIGLQIGPYTLKEKIGEGGMGVVYVAQQRQPVKRLVALKLIKPGMDSQHVIARFEAERQALAMMDHPNISRVIDAGATEQGLPYFVMELVNGLSITKYCDEQRLTILERLQLFIAVCEGVQHAHQKGILHRDLKPSNILVAQYDGRPVPKVIDFGVAKATVQSLSELSVYTQLGQIVGTLEYMSPEQAQRNQLDVDTRSDIYSLGVVLYELLAGELPFDRRRLREAAIDELMRIIREEEPPKLSTRVSTSQSRAETARNRQAEPSRLGALFRGELDWILMKAMAKDRRRRYETANGLALDLQRHVGGEPVNACPPSNFYRFQKFWQRNWVALSLTSTVAVMLIAGSLVSASLTIWAFRAEKRAKFQAQQTARANDELTRKIAEVERARFQENRANIELLRAQQQSSRNFSLALDGLSEFLIDFASSSVSLAPGNEREKQRLLTRAVAQFEQLTVENPERTDLKARYAAVLHQLASVSHLLGDLARARSCYNECIDLRKGMLEGRKRDDALVPVENGLVHAYSDLATTFADSDPRRAEDLHLRSIGVAREMRASGRTVEDGDELAIALNHYGVFLDRQGRSEEAVQQYQQAVDIAGKGTRGGVLHNLAVIRKSQDQLGEAIALVDEAIAIPNQPQEWLRQHFLLKAKLHAARGEFELAKKPCEKALRASAGALDPHWRITTRLLPAIAQSRVEDVLELLHLQARIHSGLEDFDDEAKALERARSIFQDSHGDRLLHTSELKSILGIEEALAKAYEKLGVSELAERHQQAAVNYREQISWIPAPSKGLSFALGGLGSDEARDCLIQDDHSFYIAGKIAQKADLQPGLTYRGLDGFSGAIVCKYTKDSSLIWGRSLGQPAFGRALAMARDRAGNLLVTGSIHVTDQKAVRFGDIILVTPSVGEGPIAFVAKLDPNGHVQWAQWAGRGTASGVISEHSIAAAPNGDVLVGGTYRSESQIGDEHHSLLLKHRANGDDQIRAYVACFDSKGSVRWARPIDPSVNAMITGVACDSAGGVYVCGASKSGTPDQIGQYSIGQDFPCTQPSAGKGSFGFLIKLDANGATIWVRPQLAEGAQTSFGVATDRDDKIYLAARIMAATDLDGLNVYPEDIDLVKPRSSSFETSLCCWSGSGKLFWQRSLRCLPGKFATRGLSPRSNGGVFLVGLVNSVGAHFEDQKLTRYPKTGLAALLVEVDGDGGLQRHWSFTTADRSEVRPMGVSVNCLNRVAVAGYFAGKILTPTGDILEAQSSDAFLTILEDAQTAQN